MPKNNDIKKVLVIGSGPIVIGQAAEFDYAGTQACRSLKEEGLEVVLLNSNPATIMTDKDIADEVYIEPLTVKVLERIIEKEKPDSILPTLGGQAGLNLAMELEETRQLNEELRKLSTSETEEPLETLRPQELILTGTTNESVTLQISHLLFIEAVGNYVKVSHLRDGQVHTDMLRATMKQMVEALNDYPMIVRCHRAFLVNLGQVEQIVSHSGSTQLLIKHCNESLPVSRSNMSQVKAAIKRGQSDAHIDSALA